MAADPTVTITPPPEFPRLRGLSPEAEERAVAGFPVAMDAWYAALPPEEKKIVDQRRAAEAEANRSLIEETNRRRRAEDEAAEAARKGGLPPPPSRPLPARPEKPWREIAHDAGFSAVEIEQLGRDKFLIEDRQLRQSFEPYTKPQGPIFITTDSWLNAFHVLLADTLRQVELRRADLLRPNLELLLRRVRSTPPGEVFSADILVPAQRRAELVLGPALIVLGTPPEFFPEPVRAEILRQAALIRAAEREELPAWLSPPSPELLALDYRRCRPVGYHAEDAKLADYFRAVRWLQMVPFRLCRDEEVFAYLLLDGSQTNDIRGTLESLNWPLAHLAAETDPRFATWPFSWLKASSLPIDREQLRTDALAEFRQRAERRRLAGYSDSRRANPSRTPSDCALELRFLDSVPLNENALFDRLTDHGFAPSGVLAAASFGSPFARRLLTPEVLALEPAAFRAANSNDTIVTVVPVDTYYALLRRLSSPFPPEAPTFLRQPAWAAKTTLTVLASWAQMRHTLALSARISVNLECSNETSAGFIEPHPAFYALAAEMCTEFAQPVVELNLDGRTGWYAAQQIREDADFLESLKLRTAGDLTETESARFYATITTYEEILAWKRRSTKASAVAEGWIAALREHATMVERGWAHAASRSLSLRQRWQDLQSLALQLRELSQHQLAGEPWSGSEVLFLESYGETLANIMGYEGNSWVDPRDDAPVCAEVHRDPRVDRGLTVGVGRPRLLWVLYPWQGKEILCRGSVMSYYEYWERERLTDSEWRAKLDSPAAPPPPDWLAPILAR